MSIGNQYKRCSVCGGAYPPHIEECPNCKPATIHVIETPEDAERLYRPFASNADNLGEALSRYGETHLCVGCAHATVCEVGRLTASMAMASNRILVTVADCTEYVEYQEIEYEKGESE